MVASLKASQTNRPLTNDEHAYFSGVANQCHDNFEKNTTRSSQFIGKDSPDDLKSVVNDIVLLDAVLTHGESGSNLINQFETLQKNKLISNFKSKNIISDLAKKTLETLLSFADRFDAGSSMAQAEANNILKITLGKERNISVKKINGKLEGIRGQLASTINVTPVSDEQDALSQNGSVYSEQYSIPSAPSVHSSGSDSSVLFDVGSWESLAEPIAAIVIPPSDENSHTNKSVVASISTEIKNIPTKKNKNRRSSHWEMFPKLSTQKSGQTTMPKSSDSISSGSRYAWAEDSDESSISSAKSSSAAESGSTPESWVSFDSSFPTPFHRREPELPASPAEAERQSNQSSTTSQSVQKSEASAAQSSMTSQSVQKSEASPAQSSMTSRSLQRSESSSVESDARSITGPTNEMLTRQSRSIINDLRFNQNNIIKKIEETDVSERVLKNNLEGLAKELEARIAEVNNLTVLNKNAPAAERAVRGLRLDMLRASADLAGEHFRRLCEPGYTPDESRFFSRDNEKKSVDMRHLLHEATALPQYGMSDRRPQDIVKKLHQDNVKYQTKLESLANIIGKEATVIKMLAEERENLIIEARNYFNDLGSIKNKIDTARNTGTARALFSLDSSIRKFLRIEVLQHLESLDVVHDEVTQKKNDLDEVMASVLQLKNASDNSVFAIEKENSALKKRVDMLKKECQLLKDNSLKICAVNVDAL